MSYRTSIHTRVLRHSSQTEGCSEQEVPKRATAKPRRVRKAEAEVKAERGSNFLYLNLSLNLNLNLLFSTDFFSILLRKRSHT